MKRQHKERGKKRRKDDGRVDGGGAKKRKKRSLGQKGKEKNEKGKRMDRGKSRPDSGTWVLFFFSLFFFSDPNLLIFEYCVHFIQNFINPTK